ncbi:MAG: hypothetical protein ABI853_05310 [Sphingomicrobium sp.]
MTPGKCSTGPPSYGRVRHMAEHDAANELSSLRASGATLLDIG